MIRSVETPRMLLFIQISDIFRNVQRTIAGLAAHASLTASATPIPVLSPGKTHG